MKVSKNVTKHLRDWLMITVACIIFSVSISVFLNPVNLAPGGVSGIAIIVNQVTGFPTGMTILLINIPLLLAGCFVIGKWFLIKTVYAVIVSSLLIDMWPKVLPSIIPVTDDKLLQFSAVHEGISRMTSREFLEELTRIGNEITEFLRKLSESKA